MKTETARHTPGPWIFYADLPSTDPNWHIVTTKNKMRVLANVHIEPGNEMDLANARLIAAAPDLLAAAKVLADKMERFIGQGGENDAAVIDMRRAIAAAKGGA
jgi:hypothetical protein